jgi:glutathione synthase/RimK-type ligase-like ATP-grasp enzyme
MNLVALATAAELELPDDETSMVAAALRRHGVDAVVEPWDGAFDWANADLVVVRSTWDYVRRLDEFLSWIRHVDGATTLVNPASVVQWNAHKQYLAELAGAGVPVVPTTIVPRGTHPADLRRLVADASEVVVKPAVSASAYGTARGRLTDAGLAEHLRGLVTAGDVLVQPLVPSVLTDGEVSLVYLGGRFSHAVRKVAKAGDYRVQHEHGGTVQPHSPTNAEIAVAEATLAALPARCAYARVDVVSGASGPLLMEVELIEPQLFLDQAAGSEDRFAAVLAGLSRPDGRGRAAN